MSSAEDKTQTKHNDGTGVPLTLRLRSPKATRQTFARIIREYGRGNLDERLYKSLVWGLSQYLGAFKIERELEIEKRLEEIEDQLSGGSK